MGATWIGLLHLLISGTAPPALTGGPDYVGPPRLPGLAPLVRVELESPIPPPPPPGHEDEPQPPAGVIADAPRLQALTAALRAAPSCGGACYCRGELIVKAYRQGEAKPLELWLKASDGFPTRFEVYELHGCVKVPDAIADMLRDAVTDPDLRARIEGARELVRQRALRQRLLLMAAIGLAAVMAAQTALAWRGRRRRRSRQAEGIPVCFP